VKEAYRGQGLGKRLFGELGAIARERKCGRVEWRVLKVRPCLSSVWFQGQGPPPSAAIRSPLNDGQLVRAAGEYEERVLTGPQWNKPSIDFYVECLKAQDLSEWDTMRIEGAGGIERLAAMRKSS
jgi:GNAT superfamily N-acetyltransferase